MTPKPAGRSSRTATTAKVVLTWAMSLVGPSCVVPSRAAVEVDAMVLHIAVPNDSLTAALLTLTCRVDDGSFKPRVRVEEKTIEASLRPDDAGNYEASFPAARAEINAGPGEHNAECQAAVTMFISSFDRGVNMTFSDERPTAQIVKAYDRSTFDVRYGLEQGSCRQFLVNGGSHASQSYTHWALDTDRCAPDGRACPAGQVHDMNDGRCRWARNVGKFGRDPGDCAVGDVPADKPCPFGPIKDVVVDGVPSRSAVIGALHRVPLGAYLTAPGELQEGEKQARIEVGAGFWVMESEVTVAMWNALMPGDQHRVTACATCPVVNVSRDDALAFAEAASARDGVRYRLLTANEWQWAAFGGQRAYYAGADTHDEVAWHAMNAAGRPHEVCKKAKNGFGLCDMSGNAAEWVTGNHASGDGLAYGGAWNTFPRGVAIGAKTRIFPTHQARTVGFRLAADAPPAPAP
jgi:hypothetical protein